MSNRIKVQITFTFNGDNLGGDELNELLDTRNYKINKYLDESLIELDDYNFKQVYED